MITEQDKDKFKIEKLKNGITMCEDALAKSEKYERLQENSDWKEYLNDLKVLASLHEKEIRMGEMMLLDAPNTGYIKHEGDKEVFVSSKEDWLDFITRHEIQRQEAEKWMSEPERILKMAAYSREKLPLLKKQLDEIQNATGRNGAS
jgi:hypothetical protein